MKYLKFISFLIALSFVLCACAHGADPADKTDSTADINTDIITSREPGKGTFYYPDEDFNNYITAEKEFDGTAQHVVAILYELGNYGEYKVSVNNWYIKGNTMYIDFNGELKKATGSSAQEYFSMYGTIKTLKSCFGVEYIRLTVNGANFNTPHGNYDVPV